MYFKLRSEYAQEVRKLKDDLEGCSDKMCRAKMLAEWQHHKQILEWGDRTMKKKFFK